MKIAFVAALLPLFARACKADLFHSENGLSCDVTLTSGDVIQAAIDNSSPGDVICLEAGLYNPSVTININKSIELRGPQSHVDPRPNSSCKRFPVDETKEAVIDGGGNDHVFNIVANDVTIDGLMIKNTNSDTIESTTNSDVENTNIRYNIITQSGDEGIQLRDCESCVVEFNHIFDTDGDGINMCCGSSNGIIRFNEVHEIKSTNAAIWIYDAPIGNFLVTDNLVYDVLNNDGIKMGGQSCASGDFAPNNSIERNMVYNTRQDGITVYSNNTTVKDNEIYNSRSENGALYISCVNTADVTVEGNFIHDNDYFSNTYGIRVGKDNALPLVSTIRINDNCITGNPRGLINIVSGQLDATGNWWGANDGSSPPGSGDSVEGNVNVIGFLTDEPEECKRECITICKPELVCASKSKSSSSKKSSSKKSSSKKSPKEKIRK
jgi:parallel beta-helix repeat protein